MDTEECVVVLSNTVSLVCVCFGIEAGYFLGTDWSILCVGSCEKVNSLSGDKGLLLVVLSAAWHLQFCIRAACEPSLIPWSFRSLPGVGILFPTLMQSCVWILVSLCSVGIWPQLEMGDGPALWGAPGVNRAQVPGRLCLACTLSQADCQSRGWRRNPSRHIKGICRILQGVLFSAEWVLTYLLAYLVWLAFSIAGPLALVASFPIVFSARDAWHLVSCFNYTLELMCELLGETEQHAL